MGKVIRAFIRSGKGGVDTRSCRLLMLDNEVLGIRV